MIKIAIADDHSLFRRGLISLLSEIKDFEISLEAENGMDLLENIEKNKVDIVLLDLQMPVLSGFETFKILKNKYPTIKVLILTFSQNSSELLSLVKGGADGYINKNSNPEELKVAITRICNGGFYFEESLSILFKENKSSQNLNVDLKTSDISARELEIIKLYAAEYTGMQIAEILGISSRTVETHKKNLMRKLNSKNFIGVILFALETKLFNFKDIKNN